MGRRQEQRREQKEEGSHIQRQSRRRVIQKGGRDTEYQVCTANHRGRRSRGELRRRSSAQKGKNQKGGVASSLLLSIRMSRRREQSKGVEEEVTKEGI